MICCFRIGSILFMHVIFYETSILFLGKNQFFILLVTSCSHVYSISPEYNFSVYKSFNIHIYLLSVSDFGTDDILILISHIGVSYSFAFLCLLVLTFCWKN